MIKRKKWINNAWEEKNIPLDNKIYSIRFLIDVSVIEVFINQGEITASLRFFDDDQPKVIFSGNERSDTKIYTMKDIYNY